MTSDPAPPLRRAVVFVAIALPLLLVGIDSTIVASALPTIDAHFGEGLAWSSWTITVYALGQVVMLPIAGRLGDLTGRRRLLIVALLVFASAALLCSLAAGIPQLIVFRAIQALAAGTFIPTATGIVAEHFGSARDRVIGLFSSIYPIGALLGPLVGGAITSLGDWRGIFLVGPPVAVAAAVLAAAAIPRSRQRAVERIDARGLTLFTATILPLMIGVSALGDAATHVTDLRVVACGVVGVLGASALVVRIRTAAQPFIPPTLLFGGGFGTLNLFNVCYGAAGVGFVALVPVYAHYRFGLDAFAAGTLMIPRAIGTLIVAAVAVILLRRTGYRAPIALGSITTAAGLAGHAWVPDGADPYAWLFAAGTLAGVGVGLATPAANNAALRLAPDRAGSIAGLRAMFRQSGVITSVALATSIAARSAEPAEVLTGVFAVFAGIMVALVALLPLIPEHRGAW